MVSVAGNSLLNLVTALAQELGPTRLFSTTSAAVAQNTVISTTLTDTEAPTEKYGGYYLYCTSDAAPNSVLGNECRVKRNGFVGSSGTFTTASSYDANPKLGAAFLLGGTLPVTDQDGLVGIRTCVNRAIRKLWYRHWYPFTAVAGQIEYDLGALWWASRDRFLRLMDPDPGSGSHPPVSQQAWDVVQNGDTWTLQLGAAIRAGDTFWLIVEAPLNFRLYLSGAWANQSSPTAGLTLGADACLGEWNHVFQCSLYECMKVLALQAGGNRKAYWAGRVAEQRAVVAAIKSYQMDDDGRSLGEGPENVPTGGIGYGDRGLFSGGWGPR